MDSLTVSEFAALIAAIMGPMLGFVVASMRFQHLEAVKTRDLISSSERETRRLLGGELVEQRRDLADARERLARIEGHFGIAAPPQGALDDEAADAGDKNEDGP